MWVGPPPEKKILEYMPFSVVWCLLINGIGCLVGRDYLHYLCPLKSQHYKRRLLKHSSSGTGGMRVVFLMRATRVRVPPFAEIVLLPFHISYYIRKAFVFNKNKNEGNNRKV